ncbi:MAG TPA: M14 family murein peptide amidase A [Ramlibacter sp.]|uniref:M14 family murein peptide amidase A n=1 Tax=Ramlibacter sp. TaxID=1917967 RepID=UPI002CE813EB|nr:M14 family murein peptide amidase A [Ramlibacter sp.]HVZ42568.1 M14 family murein peptide amidase A [Ramlibacter sp.]
MDERMKARVRAPMKTALVAALLAAAAAQAAPPGAALPRAPCDELSHRLPNVTRKLCESAALADSGARSVKGAPIWRSDVSVDKAQLRVLVIGAIHGDELSSASLALHWLQLARTEPTELAQPVHWRFVPLVNPDGMLARPPQRGNANGVDLNRNFPTPGWEREAASYWDKRTHKDPRRWPGKKPLSEPETKFIFEQMQSFRPHLIVSIHAPYGILDFDGPTVPPSKLGRLYLDQIGIFPGSLGNYGGVHKGIPVVTIELPNAQRTPLDAEMRQMWLDLLRWMSEKGPALASSAR